MYGWDIDGDLMEHVSHLSIEFREYREEGIGVGSRMIGSCRIGVLCSSGAMC
jgi:hypothetical protein